MQHCAQCSRTASTSAQKLITALELPWPLVQPFLDGQSTTQRQNVNARRNGGSYEQTRALHGSNSSFVELAFTEQAILQKQPRQLLASTSTSTNHPKKQQIGQRHLSTSSRNAREAAPAPSKHEPITNNIETGSPAKQDNAGKQQTSSSQATFRPTSPSTTAPTAPTQNQHKKNTEEPTSSKLRPLTDDVIVDPTSDQRTKQKAPDIINTLLAYPTLYDPIRRPRYPVVLCHGLYGFDTWGLELLPALKVHYWADVLQVLKGIVGIDPIVVGVPGTGAITERAKQLHNVLRNDKRLRGKEVNLVGHSMGGLDCRHLLTNIRPEEYHPISLTTLATPHRGSPFMAWCRANIGIGDIAKAAAEATRESSSSPFLQDSDLPYSLKTPLFSRSKWSSSKNNDTDNNSRERPSSEREDREAFKKTKAAARSVADQAEGKAKRAAAITKSVFINLPGLNYSLGTSLASYLLDLLDSPAYSNLTSDYLENEFNPNTPDRDDIRYFSIAARTPKLSVAHPLWLPKLIVDKAQELEKAKDAQLGRKRPDDWQWGNDGLVPVESAKWGEFLGILDGADHWSIRGGAGFTTEPKSKKITNGSGSTTPSAEKQAVVNSSTTNTSSSASTSSKPAPGESLASDHPNTSKQAKQKQEVEEEQSEFSKLSEKAKSAISSVTDIASPVTELTSIIPSTLSFDWQDINKAVFKGIDDRDGTGKNGSPSTAVSTGSGNGAKSANASDGKSGATPPSTSSSNTDALKTLGTIANWVVKRIPLPIGNNKQLRSSIDPAFPLDDTTAPPAASSSKSAATSSASKEASTGAGGVSNAARLLFGSSSSSKPSGGKNSNTEGAKFSHERFYVALCKKLYDEGM